MLKTINLFILILSISFGLHAQSPVQKPEGYDTAKDSKGNYALSGILYVSDSSLFTIKSGYAYKVSGYNYQYEADKTAHQGDSVVKMIKTKKYVSSDYFVIKDSLGKQKWIKVNGLIDFNLDLRKPR